MIDNKAFVQCFDIAEDDKPKINIVANIITFYGDYFLYNSKQLTNVIIVNDKLGGYYYDPKCDIWEYYTLTVSSDRIVGMLKRTMNKYKKMGIHR